MATDPGMTEPDVTAGELALGLLDGPERAAALRRMLAEPAFAREVERWREHFGLWFGLWPEVAAPDTAWPRIEAAIAPAKEARASSGWFWKAATAGSGLIAAGLAFALLLRPTVPVPVIPKLPVSAPLVAALASPDKAQPIAAFYDTATNSVRLPAAAYAPAGKSAELWAIGKDGVPRSIGVLAGAGATRLTVPAALRPQMAAGLTLAVSVEPIGGSPTGRPTGPVVAAGTLVSA